MSTRILHSTAAAYYYIAFLFPHKAIDANFTRGMCGFPFCGGRRISYRSGKCGCRYRIPPFSCGYEL